jgi:hypothetical protein
MIFKLIPISFIEELMLPSEVHSTFLNAHSYFLLGVFALRESNIEKAFDFYTKAAELFQKALDQPIDHESRNLWEAEYTFIELERTRLQSTDVSPNLMDESSNLLQSIRTVFPQTSDWGSIQGLSTAKETFDSLLTIFQHYSHSQNYVKLPKLILLFGPPGCGKTLLAEGFAKKTGLPFYDISPAKILSRYIGDSEKKVAAVFQQAQAELDGCILFFDEFDSFTHSASTDESEVMARVRSQILTSLDKVSKSENKIFVIATTNHPERLSAPMRRRFDRQIFIPPPDEQTIWNLICDTIRYFDSSFSITRSNWQNIIPAFLGCTAKEVFMLVRDAVLCFPSTEKDLIIQVKHQIKYYTPYFCTFDALEPSIYLFYDQQFGKPKSQIESYPWELRILQRKTVLIHTHPKPNLIYKRRAETRQL